MNSLCATQGRLLLVLEYPESQNECLLSHLHDGREVPSLLFHVRVTDQQH